MPDNPLCSAIDGWVSLWDVQAECELTGWRAHDAAVNDCLPAGGNAFWT